MHPRHLGRQMAKSAWNPMDQLTKERLGQNMTGLVDNASSLAKNDIAMGAAGMGVGANLGGSVHDSLGAKVLGGAGGGLLGLWLAQQFRDRQPPTKIGPLDQLRQKLGI